MTIQINIIKSYRDVIAVCDSELLGKTFQQVNPNDSEHPLLLDLKESFYKGNEKSIEEIKKLLIFYSKEDATFNIAGEKSVQAGIEAGIISAEAVRTIQGIPYVLRLI